MASLIEPPLSVTPESLVALAVERMQDTYPGWQPNPASPEYRMFLAHAAIDAETLILAFEVPELIIRFVGAVVYQTRPFPALYAETTSTWTAIDSLDLTIEAGTIVLVTPEGGQPIAFEVTEAAVIEAGHTSVSGVKLRAVEPGPEGNVTGPAVPGEMLSRISTVALTAPGSGGAEGESTPAYTRRIVELAKLIKPEPIIPVDFANFVRLLIPGVTRAVAIDEYNAETGEHEKERCVTVAVTAEGGAPASSEKKTEALNLLIGAREASFKNFIINPTYNEIEVAFVGVKETGFEAADVQARAIAAIENFLSPATWGVPATGDTTSWVLKSTLRYQDMVTVLNNVEGFDYYTELKINGGTADIALTGVAPLTKPKEGHITGTVT